MPYLWTLRKKLKIPQKCPPLVNVVANLVASRISIFFTILSYLGNLRLQIRSYETLVLVFKYSDLRKLPLD